MKRWPELKDRKPEHLAKGRAQASNRENIEQFHSGLMKCLKENGLDRRSDLPCRLWNCDESGFTTSVAAKRVLARRGARVVYDVQGGSGREMFTILAAGSAAGTTKQKIISIFNSYNTTAIDRYSSDHIQRQKFLPKMAQRLSSRH